MLAGIYAKSVPVFYCRWRVMHQDGRKIRSGALSARTRLACLNRFTLFSAQTVT